MGNKVFGHFYFHIVVSECHPLFSSRPLSVSFCPRRSFLTSARSHELEGRQLLSTFVLCTHRYKTPFPSRASICELSEAVYYYIQATFTDFQSFLHKLLRQAGVSFLIVCGVDRLTLRTNGGARGVGGWDNFLHVFAFLFIIGSFSHFESGRISSLWGGQERPLMEGISWIFDTNAMLNFVHIFVLFLHFQTVLSWKGSSLNIAMNPPLKIFSSFLSPSNF